MNIFKFQSFGLCWLGLGVIVIIAIITCIIFILYIIFGLPFLNALTAIGSVATAIGVFLAIMTLRSEHEWNRRHYTVEFLDSWNESARKHLRILEENFPDFFAVPDFIANPDLMDSWRLHQNQAKQLVKVKSEGEGFDKSKVDIRGHLIELLNYFEGIASAYEQHVVDRAAIEDSVGTVILDVCVYFQPFIEEMRKINRRDPWPPLSRVVELWLTAATRQKAQTQAEEASRRHEEAFKKFELKLKKPTGI
jgi:hypothetical protein